MKLSLTSRLNLLITMALVTIIVIVSLFTRTSLTRIINSKQSEVYKEKLSTLHTAMERKNKRLELTGMEEAYRDDFQAQLLSEFRDLYYNEDIQRIYPFIVDSSGSVILHPVLSHGDTSISKSDFVLQVLEMKSGDFYYTYSDGTPKWAQFQEFKEWGWIVGYSMPIEEKYATVETFQRILLQILLIVSLAVLLIITLLVKRQLHPITALTAASAEISTGNLTYEITSGGVGEIAALTKNFKTMQTSIQKTISKLAKSEENLRITMKSIGDGVIATDENGLVVQLNPVAEKITGWSRREALGKTLKEIFEITSPEDGSVIDTVEKVMSSGEIVDLGDYGILKNREGINFKVADSAAPIHNDNGQIVGVVLVFRDVTEEYEMKEQLQQSQKMDAIGQLAGGVAHDFNNMLGGIVGATELLKRIHEEEETVELLDIIDQASTSAASLTKKLLAFSQKGKIESTPISVHKAITEATAILQRSINKKVAIKTDFTASANNVVGDMSQLQNVFLNLGINAGHAMEKQGGTLTYRTTNIQIDQVYCEASPFDITPGEFLQIEVEDTGCGIPLENITKIFEPFYTTKETGKGTGLGLAAVYGSIKQHHGAVTVYSEEGVGTKFHILLPLSDSEVTQEEKETIPAKGEGTILVVDDEQIIRAMAQHMLETLGYKVILAVDGLDGIQKYTEHQQEIDLVIIDVIMPNLDGRSCFLQLQEINPAIKAILSSGFTKDADLNSLFSRGLLGFIHKPYRMVELSRILSQALASED